MNVKDFRDLIVWQKAMDLVEQVYRASASFPKEEVYGLTSQMRRSAVSIPSNIAEGHGRYTTPEYVHFISISRGSLKELETQVCIARRLGYMNTAIENRLIGLATEVGRLITALSKSLNRKRLTARTIRRGVDTQPPNS